MSISGRGPVVEMSSKRDMVEEGSVWGLFWLDELKGKRPL
jgi:hypothetical protein